MLCQITVQTKRSVGCSIPSVDLVHTVHLVGNAAFAYPLLAQTVSKLTKLSAIQTKVLVQSVLLSRNSVGQTLHLDDSFLH